MENSQALSEKVKAAFLNGESDEEILQSVLPFLGKDPESDERLVERLAAIPDPKIARLLHRLLDGRLDKKVRKQIKRSLYRLKSKGMAVEERPRERGASILRPPTVEPPQGLASVIDYLGQRLLLLIVPHSGRGIRVMQGVVSDTHGLVDFMGQELNRKNLRDFLRTINEGRPFRLVETEPSYVAFQLAEAYRNALEKGETSTVEDYSSIKSEIERIKRVFDNALVYSWVGEEEIAAIAGDDRLLEESGKLVEGGPFYSWQIDEDEIRPYRDALTEAGGSRIVLNEAQKEARMHDIYQRALFELFPEDRRLLYKRRLEEMAYCLFRLERPEEARIALSAAIDLEKPFNSFRPNPFLVQLIIRSIHFLTEAEETKRENLSLIIRP